MIAASVVGWLVAAYRAFPPVRLVSWWIRRVIWPLLTPASWLQRTAVILANNSTLLALLVFLGRWRFAGPIGVVVLGLSLGMALRALAAETNGPEFTESVLDLKARRRMWIGVTLNLLEVPAIVVAIGLSIGLRTVPLDSGAVWDAFGVLVLPALVLAAAGEALWLGVDPGPGGAQSPDEPQRDPPE